MKAILGRKIGMSQTFSPAGEVIPVTLIHAYQNIVSLRRDTIKDGYSAVQLALPKRLVEPDEKKGTRKEAGFAAKMEFKGEIASEISAVSVDQFVPGDVVEVIGMSKGKGFQGVVKRHKFKGGPASHGHTDWERKAGSIGSRFPQHTRKGKRMAGRMGHDRVTVKNLQVVVVDAAKNLLAIKGAVPGHKGAIVAVRQLGSSKL
ncbi:MAG: 50S ribosomal protein L3 [Candidatus Andersenbacteria bacterium]|nr:50S ribosomal protein L3 [Candidatus Andersenbacteria bacterium]